MTLTLGFLASVLILLPGLVALASFNLRTGRAGARRPELQLTAINAIVAAVIISFLTHYLSYIVSEGTIDLGVAFHQRFPTLPCWPSTQNPVTAYYLSIASSSPVPAPTAVSIAALLALEVFAIMAFTTSDTFDLLMDRLDWNGQGWVFQHITRPAENGYAPIGHVFTSTMSGAYGIAYKGVVIDARQGTDGQIASIALARPERFLYEVGSFQPPRRPRWPWAQPAGELDPTTGFVLHGKEYVGGVVQLESRVISNIVVHSIARSLLDEIVPDEPTAEAS